MSTNLAEYNAERLASRSDMHLEINRLRALCQEYADRADNLRSVLDSIKEAVANAEGI